MSLFVSLALFPPFPRTSAVILVKCVSELYPCAALILNSQQPSVHLRFEFHCLYLSLYAPFFSISRAHIYIYTLFVLRSHARARFNLYNPTYLKLKTPLSKKSAQSNLLYNYCI